jgi:hypothetical protein
VADIIWDSELGPSWPDDWSHTTVHAQFVAVTGDGADTDRLPDIAPSGNGEVIFTPSLRTVRYVGEEGPYVVSLKQYRAVVDNEGYLCTPDESGQPGERGIVLPSTDAPVIEPRGEDDNAFTWRVDFDIPSVNIRSDNIAVPVDGPYDLVDLLSPERAAGVVHVIDRVSARQAVEAAQEATAARDLVLPARDQTLAARDETLQHGITVDTSVGTRVYVGDTMIYGDTGWRDVSDFISNMFDPDGVCEIKRENNYVSLRFRATYIGSAADRSAVNLMSTIAGFRPPGFIPVGTGDQDTSSGSNLGNGQIGTYSTGTLLTYYRPSAVRWEPGHIAKCFVIWTTNNSWPTSLPGTPA